jgi:lysozyme family protein
MKPEHFGRFIRNIWEVLKCGAREEWTNRVKHEVLRRIREERNILHAVKRRKANWIGHVLFRNCFLKHNVEGEIQ